MKRTMRLTTVILSAAFCLTAWNAKADTSKVDDAALIQAAEQMLHDKPTTAPVAAAQAVSPKPAALKAAEAPLFPVAKKSTSEPSLVWRLVLSLVFIAAIGGSLLFAAKRWGRPGNKGGDKARIEMMHQFHMGPRRSLALIRVAGEVMLIGVTDHNINMLKPITLIDEDLENLAQKDFNNFLEDEFSIEDVRTAIKARA